MRKIEEINVRILKEKKSRCGECGMPNREEEEKESRKGRKKIHLGIIKHFSLGRKV